MNKLEIANHYSNAWNKLDTNLIAPYLHEEFVYGSQMVLENINGKKDYLDYLKKKYSAIILMDELVFAEVAEFQTEPCLVLTQQIKNSDSSLPKERHGILLLKFENNLLKSAHMCMIAPTINDVTRYT